MLGGAWQRREPWPIIARRPAHDACWLDSRRSHEAGSEARQIGQRLRAAREGSDRRSQAPRRLVGRQASEEQALRRWHAAEEAAPPARQGDALEDGVQPGEELAHALGAWPLDAGDPVVDLARLRV